MKTKVNSHGPGLHTSAESARQSKALAVRVWELIVEFARKAGSKGITINEAERLIGDHKGRSVSPRFSELVRKGRLVRVLVGRGAPTKRFPSGIPRYLTRYDEQTRRNVIVHWLPEFAPAADADFEQEEEGLCVP